MSPSSPNAPLTGQQKPGKGLDYENTVDGFCWYGPAHCSHFHRMATLAPVWILPRMQQ